MKGTKRLATSDSTWKINDTVGNKRMLAGSTFDVHRAEPSQQHSSLTLVLDVQRAQLSQQHVRALNTQFASWVQAQLKNHPDELWEDGVQDYLAHASNIMEKFSDVVNWLKANVAKGGSTTAFESRNNVNKLVPQSTDKESVKEKSSYAPLNSNGSFPAPWSSGVLSGAQNSGLSTSSQSTGLFSNNHSSSLFSNIKNPGLFSTNQGSELISNNESSGGFSNSQNFGLFSNGKSSGVFSTGQTPGMSNNPSFGLSSTNNSGIAATSSTQNSNPFSFGQSSATGFGLSSNNGNSSTPLNYQNPVVSGSKSIISTDPTATGDADDENDPQPSSPSVKKAEEKGIVVVHEVKCKLYVKSSDPTDGATWKDKGTGKLSIKCKEGVSKGTKESFPTIVVRNEVGKVLLNALLYSGIKTNLQKNSIVAIFHSLDDSGGNGSVVARTFLFRTKTEEDRNNLATAIQDYAPAS